MKTVDKYQFNEDQPKFDSGSTSTLMKFNAF